MKYDCKPRFDSFLSDIFACLYSRRWNDIKGVANLLPLLLQTALPRLMLQARADGRMGRHSVAIENCRIFAIINNCPPHTHTYT